MACAVVGAVLIAGLAQFSFHLPFTPVPITGQTLGVLLVGAAYGPASRRGDASASTSRRRWWDFPCSRATSTAATTRASTSWARRSPSAGYLWGFLLAAALVGWLARRGWDRSFRSSVSAMFFGELVIYACGIPWLHARARASTCRPR